MSSQIRWVHRLALGAFCVCITLLLSRQVLAQQSDVSFQRFAPETGQVVDVQEQELRIGEIYRHFSPRLNRRVWSFYLGNGRFWNALGPGTKQPAGKFNLRLSTESAMERIREQDETFQQTLLRTDRPVHFQLGADDVWRVSRNATMATIYDLETRHRFEQHFPDRYIPVGHTFGYEWIYTAGGRYQPASYGFGGHH